MVEAITQFVDRGYTIEKTAHRLDIIDCQSGFDAMRSRASRKVIFKLAIVNLELQPIAVTLSV